MGKMPFLNTPVQKLKVAILPLDLPCSGPVTHSGEILTTGKSHGKKLDYIFFFTFFYLWPDDGQLLNQTCSYWIIHICVGLNRCDCSVHRLWPTTLLFGGKILFNKPSFACCSSQYPKMLSDRNIFTVCNIFPVPHRGYTIHLLTGFWLTFKNRASYI